MVVLKTVALRMWPPVLSVAQVVNCFVEKILEAREHQRLISLSSVADGGEGRVEEAFLKNPLSLALSRRSAGGAREWLPLRTGDPFHKAIVNLLYRRLGVGGRLRIANPRYSRLPVCATLIAMRRDHLPSETRLANNR